jgi:hypothetical protein
VWLHVDLHQISSPEECDVKCKTVVLICLMVIDFIREKEARKKLHLIDRSGIDFLPKKGHNLGAAGGSRGKPVRL